MSHENHLLPRQSNESQQVPIGFSASEHSPYTIYLLTVWYGSPVNASDTTAWRFRLENPRTKEIHGFAGVEALLAGLVDKMKNDLRPIVVEPYAEECPGEK
jgi:hypothetical protein